MDKTSSSHNFLAVGRVCCTACGKIVQTEQSVPNLGGRPFTWFCFDCEGKRAFVKALKEKLSLCLVASRWSRRDAGPWTNMESRL